jgi:hypothetical protein
MLTLGLKNNFHTRVGRDPVCRGRNRRWPGVFRTNGDNGEDNGQRAHAEDGKVTLHNTQ